MPSLWVSSDGGQLVPLESSGYATESEFQRLLADSPELLASALDSTRQQNSWLLIDRELGIRGDEADGGRWSLDHLFIDSAGMPTLVEVKRSSDPRARREVVAQMLDYAASFSFDWSAERLRGQWESRLARQRMDREFAMGSFLEQTDFDTEDEFWSAVQTNVDASRLRLLFVADRLSPNLVRIIEYLNVQLRDTEVLGVEVARHGGEQLVAYQPLVHGRTSAVPRTKAPSPERTMDEFEDVLRATHGEAVLEGVRSLVAGAEKLGGAAIIGTSATNPLLLFKFVTPHGKRWPLGINPQHGKVVLCLDYLRNYAPFDDESVRADLADDFTKAVGVPLTYTENKLGGRPWANVATLAAPGVVDNVVTFIRSIVERRDGD